MSMKGSIVVVNDSAPAKFKKVKPGSLFVVTAVRSADGEKITVADAANPAGIATRKKYFHVLTRRDQDGILSTGNTDLAVRLRAVQDYAAACGHSTTQADYGYVRAGINNVFLNLPKAVASALSKKNPEALAQAKLANAVKGW